ncbi:MAG: tetratricopeptide repeat protein [Candidatus Obscuribacterales bacterium]
MRQLLLLSGAACAISISFLILESPTSAQVMTADQQSVAAYKGIEALKSGQNGIAISEFTKLINANPSNSEYRSLRASAYSDSGDHQKAAADFEVAIRNGDKRPMVKDSLNNEIASLIAAKVVTDGKSIKDTMAAGKAALDRKDYKTALGYYNVLAGQSKPEVHQFGLYARGGVFLMMGRKANAKADAEALIREGADNPDIRRLLSEASSSESARPPLVKNSKQVDPAKISKDKDIQDYIHKRF